MSPEPDRTRIWRLVDVRASERPRFLFFLWLSAVISFAQTIGLVGAEALFLARVGPTHLPLAFVLASALTVGASLAYAAVVGQARNDLLFARMLLLAGGGLVLLGVATYQGLGWAPYGLLCAFYLTYSIFLMNHFWTFVGDYFDTLASKRVFPLFQTGASLGGLLGGVVAVAGSRLGSPAILVFLWAGSLGLAAVLVLAARAMLRLWYPLELEERDESSVEGLRVAAHYLSRSVLGRSLLLSTTGMVLALFVMQYLYSQVFVREFPEEAQLATFLGAYLALTNLLELVTAGLITPWLIQRLGVGSANLVHPILTFASFVLLAVDPRLYAAALARVNREMLENCLAAPVRALVQNAFPSRLLGMIRAFLEGVVVHTGMVLAGALLIVMGPITDPTWIGLTGGSAAVLYLVANLRVRRGYLTSLVEDVQSGRVDLRERSQEVGALSEERLVHLWGNLLPEDRAHSSPALHELAGLLARRKMLTPLLQAASHPNAQVRRASIEALATECPGSASEALVRALDDRDPDVRLAAIGAWESGATNGQILPEARLRERTADPDPRVRAAAARTLGLEGESVLAAMALADDAATASAALRCIPPSLSELALRRVDDADPRIRAAALNAVTRLESPVPLDLSLLTDQLKHPDTAVRRAVVSALATLPHPEAQAALARALADPSRDVRHSAARILSKLADHGIALARTYLENHPLWASEAALLAVAWSRTPHARPILVSQFRLRARQAWNASRVLRVMPRGQDLAAQFMRIAYEDALAQNERLAFRILELLEEPTIVRTVEKVLLFGSGRLRADALEVLSHLGDREGARHLVMTLEHVYLSEASGSAPTIEGDADLGGILGEAMRAMDRWIRIASAAQKDQMHSMEATMERLLALRNVPLFSQMSLDQLEAINSLLLEQEFVSGELIIREGDPSNDLYLVMKGSVQVVRSHGSDHAIALGQLGAGECFGEIAALDESPRSATIIAAEDCALLALPGDRFKELIYDMPELAFAIFRVLTERVRNADERLSELVHRPALPA